MSRYNEQEPQHYRTDCVSNGRSPLLFLGGGRGRNSRKTAVRRINNVKRNTADPWRWSEATLLPARCCRVPIPLARTGSAVVKVVQLVASDFTKVVEWTSRTKLDVG